MSLSAWRVNCGEQQLLVAEHTMVEYLNMAQLTVVPGGEGLWSAITYYDNQWLPVMCWIPADESKPQSLLILQLSKQKRMALTVSQSPVRISFSDENFINDESQIPAQWSDAVVSCVDCNGVAIPIILPDKLQSIRYAA